MTMARTIESLLQKHNISYGLMCHSHTWSSKETACAANVRPDQIIKAVVLTDGRDLLVAVLPSHRHLQLNALSKTLGRQLELANEAQIASVFKDCELGAIPPIGIAYGLETVVDESLANQAAVYFVDGDHEELVCMNGAQFFELLGNVRIGRFSH